MAKSPFVKKPVAIRLTGMHTFYRPSGLGLNIFKHVKTTFIVVIQTALFIPLIHFFDVVSGCGGTCGDAGLPLQPQHEEEQPQHRVSLHQHSLFTGSLNKFSSNLET